MNRSTAPRLTSCIAALVLAGATASAGAQTAVAPAATAAPMDFQQVVARVVSQGYSDVREVERKGDKLYEIKARNGRGQRVELYVDARSGEILREEAKR